MVFFEVAYWLLITESYYRTYKMIRNPGGTTSPFVLFINTMSQTALLAVLLD